MGDGLATINMARKLGAAAPLTVMGSWVPILHNVPWAEAYLHNKWHLDPSNRLATIHQRFTDGRPETRLLCSFNRVTTCTVVLIQGRHLQGR